MATNTNNVGTPGIPDPETIQTPGISDAAKRKIFFAVVGLLVVVILANVFSPNTPPKNPVTAREQKHTAQTPTVQQVNDLKKSIDDSTRILQENLDRDNEVAAQRNQQKQTLAELQAADALRDAQQQRAIFEATHGDGGFAWGCAATGAVATRGVGLQIALCRQSRDSNRPAGFVHHQRRESKTSNRSKYRGRSRPRCRIGKSKAGRRTRPATQTPATRLRSRRTAALLATGRHRDRSRTDQPARWRRARSGECHDHQRCLQAGHTAGTHPSRCARPR